MLREDEASRERQASVFCVLLLVNHGLYERCRSSQTHQRSNVGRGEAFYGVRRGPGSEVDLVRIFGSYSRGTCRQIRRVVRAMCGEAADVRSAPLLESNLTSNRVPDVAVSRGVISLCRRERCPE